MSIFTKITLLFSISLLLMIGIGYQIDTINTQKYESLILQKYIVDGRKIFGWMATSSANELDNKLKTINLVKTAPELPERMLVRQPHTFGVFEIFEAKNGDYVLHVRYIDEEIYLHDKSFLEVQKKGWVLNTLVIADIAVLIIIFISILRMLSPLNSIASSMRSFAKGAYRSRSEVRTRDEIGEVAQTYNEMAQTIENLILSRQELLRDVGHELRTPIARGLFALEQIEDSKAKATLKHSFQELDQLTRELLEIEKLQATDTIQSEKFSAETLVMEALSKLCLEDESAVKIEIKNNFILSGDVHYLSLALKNLLDNALKYTDRLPIVLEIDINRISVSNHGKPLEKDFSYFLTPFTRQESSRTTQGFGLGLNIVSKIIIKHGYQLTYDYKNEYHCFSIIVE
ncbi:MAG: ArsS family sensor histidine kinase [Sulfuricurvum sp.]|uniref:ArsS family sensor histidine kinase n=1 Tax=Sulfuricurvum sp. TaxID=2025608 RepID=UPI00262E1AF8|nr:ArsS family sensor histidine kinase [Sulfuricurvum sp.]MDD2368481.1 ArsS family sensor histidine kinase [Sulfuricurvum sp.]MDD2950648.1 ArsS family sensor histidine kinase [Sulfuricurvum sp.]MDD5117666.1 ArsS family sensor histidine kinase [Sulfuricurvum sp.]